MTPAALSLVLLALVIVWQAILLVHAERRYRRWHKRLMDERSRTDV